MKLNRNAIIFFLILVVLAAGYRLFPDRPLGFAPQIAIALFAGALIRNRSWALAIPVLSIFISDLIFQVAYNMGLTNLAGFYEGQWLNYVLFGGITFIGIFLKNLQPLRIGIATVVAPTLYFLISNFAVWFAGGGFARPKTWDGLLMCYSDALPFYQGSLAATIIFSVALFGGYFAFRTLGQKQVVTANK